MNPVDIDEHGLTLEEALERYSDPQLWEKYVELKPFLLNVFSIGGPPILADRKNTEFRKVSSQLQKALLEKLSNGKLTGTAFEHPLVAQSRRVLVNAGTWRLLNVDFDDSTAAGHGLKLIDIRVSENRIRKPVNRGRKPETLTRNEEIYSAFEALVSQGKVSFVRGGLVAAAEDLHAQFPDYKVESIRKIIQPSYKSQAKKK